MTGPHRSARIEQAIPLALLSKQGDQIAFTARPTKAFSSHLHSSRAAWSPCVFCRCESPLRYSLRVAPHLGVLYTLLNSFIYLSGQENTVMQRQGRDDDRIADNLRRTIELTEIGLALRQAVLLQQGCSDAEAMAQVMRDIRRAKELAWRQSEVALP